MVHSGGLNYTARPTRNTPEIKKSVTRSFPGETSSICGVDLKIRPEILINLACRACYDGELGDLSTIVVGYQRAKYWH